MRAEFDKMNVKKIVFETGDVDVMVNATIQQGNLSYESDLILNFSDLNLLINKMQQKVNESIDIAALFESEKMYNGNLLYTLDIERSFESAISIDSMIFNNDIKQIRA